MKKSRESNGKKVSFGDRVKAMFCRSSKNVVDFNQMVRPVLNTRVPVIPVNYQGIDMVHIHQYLPYDTHKVVPNVKEAEIPNTNGIAWEILTNTPQPTSPGAEYNRNYSDFTPTYVMNDTSPKYGPRLIQKAKKHEVYTEKAIHIRQGANGKFYRCR